MAISVFGKPEIPVNENVRDYGLRAEPAQAQPVSAVHYAVEFLVATGFLPRRLLLDWNQNLYRP